MLRTHMLNLVERKLRYLILPITINFWDGRELNLGNPFKVKLLLRSPRVLSALTCPSLGEFAKNYVEKQTDLEGDMRTLFISAKCYAMQVPILTRNTG
ncbi:DUF7884 domain-containing protein [Sulfuriferula thiophila]|uniref:DUF7884 domain-containing protein n=1 Tax=Sulfuriferula thiophila TaxID=1781211 RepID=UPI000F604A50|nr:hypothetical protein [Sulfuriferula thiophila]